MFAAKKLLELFLRSRILNWAAGVAALLSSACTSAAPTLLIDNVTILDGRGGQPIRQAAVLVEGDRIRAIVGRGVRRPSARRTIDGRGRYLLPGFIDMHAHLFVPRCEAPAGQHSRFDRRLSEKMLGGMLDYGITTVRSPATPTIEGLRLRDDLNAGRVRGPRALASAELINDPAMSAAALRDYVRDALSYRPDYFKVYSRLSPDQVAVVVDEAHRHGVPVIGHLQRTSWKQGVEAGVDYLTHAVDWSEGMLRAEDRQAYVNAISARGGLRARLDWLELLDLNSAEVRATIAEIRGKGISIDPTLVAYDSKFSGPAGTMYRSNPALRRFPELEGDWKKCGNSTADWTGEDRARWRRLFPKLQRFVRMMHQAGIPLTTGSDVTNEWVIPGESLHQEFELLDQAGFKPAEILRMTGQNAGAALRRKDVGLIAPSARADMVLLQRDPLDDISNTRSIVWVMQSGRITSGRPEGS